MKGRTVAYETLTVAIAALAAVAIVTFAALRGWQGWLSYKLRELDRRGDSGKGSAERKDGEPTPAARIELADLKERVRQLEAIAAGVDL